MRLSQRILCAYAVSAAVACSTVLPAAASQPETESSTEADTESVLEALENTGDVIGQVISEGRDFSVSVEILEPLQEAISDAAKGTDMSWLQSVTFSGASAGNQDGGIDASGVLSLNGTELYHGSVSADLDDQMIYLVCPEFRRTPFVLNLKKAAGSAEDAARKTAEENGVDVSGAADAFQKDYVRLAEEAETLFSSVKAEEWKQFAGRYRDAFLQNAKISHRENVTVTAGPLSGGMSTTTVTADQSAMASFLSASLESLKEDELIQKLIRSDFAADLFSTVLTETKLGSAVDKESLYSEYRSLLAKVTDRDLKKVPGFTLTYGTDNEGKPGELEFTVLYSAVAVNVFSVKMLSRDTHTAFQFDLGPLVSSLLAARIGGDPNGETGILVETDTASGEIHDSFAVMAAGQELAMLKLDDFLPEDVRNGILSGTASLTVGDAVYEAAFSHPEDGKEIITGRYNGTDYFTVTAVSKENNRAKIDSISRKKAMEVYDPSTWDAYIKDAKLTKMIRSLSGAGVPDDIIETLTSGEASTEKSRENTDEVDGTGELANGEVGGADIGNDRAA